MLSPEARRALQQDGRAGLAAEIARRLGGDRDAAQEHADLEQVWSELELMASRFAALLPQPPAPTSRMIMGGSGAVIWQATRTADASLAHELAHAKNWDQIDESRIAADLSPAAAIALVLTIDPAAAKSMFRAYLTQRR